MMVAVCSVFDRKARTYGPPMVFGNVELAQRMARSLMEQRGSQSDLEKYPEDFDLFYIGEFDQDTGLITRIDAPKFLFTFADLLEVK